MAKSSKPSALKHLLDLCDEIRTLRSRIQDPGLKVDTATRLRRRSTGVVERLAQDLRAHRFRPELRSLLKGLGVEHFLLLATLLDGHFRSEDGGVDGRALLSTVFDSSFERLSGLEMLTAERTLRAEGLIEVDADEHADSEQASDEALLEASFRLTPEVVQAFLGEIGRRKKSRSLRIRPYGSVRDYLIDLKLLLNLYAARAKRLYSDEKWNRFRGGEGDRVVDALNRKISRFGHSVEKRLAQTPQARDFAPIRFAHDHGLSVDDLLIVTQLVFLELHQGNPYVDTVKLLQLVSAREEELFAKRRLFHAQAVLLRRKIVAVETMVEGRELTGEVRLSSGMLEPLLGAPTAEGPIGVDEKLDFHLFLEDLDTSSFLNEF